MKPSEMNEEQRREYNRIAKQRQRDRQKQEKERLNIPNARDYVMPEHQQKQLNEYTRSVMTAIATDLNLEKLTDPDEYIITGVSCVLFGIKHQFTQVVDDPSGMLVGGWFPDATASEAIKHVHRFPSLLGSSTFADLYWKFLHTVVKWSKENEQYVTPEFIQEVEAEIAGPYVLGATTGTSEARTKGDSRGIVSATR